MNTNATYYPIQVPYDPLRPGDTEYRPGRVLQQRPCIQPTQNTRAYYPLVSQTRGEQWVSQLDGPHTVVLPRNGAL